MEHFVICESVQSRDLSLSQLFGDILATLAYRVVTLDFDITVYFQFDLPNSDKTKESKLILAKVHNLDSIFGGGF